jgi:hypothetical protein
VWASFTAMLEYKAARYGRTFGRVDRFSPSTRMCSDCGRINEKMALDVRSWTCPCGSTHDRDVNAAINIKAAGRADFNDRGVQVRPAPVPAKRDEAVIHPSVAANSARSVEGISVLRAERTSKAVVGHEREEVGQVVGQSDPLEYLPGVVGASMSPYLGADLGLDSAHLLIEDPGDEFPGHHATVVEW